MLIFHSNIHTQWMGLPCARRYAGSAHFLFSSGTEERVLFVEREEKGLHEGLRCSSAHKMTRVKSLASVRKPWSLLSVCVCMCVCVCVCVFFLSEEEGGKKKRGLWSGGAPPSSVRRTLEPLLLPVPPRKGRIQQRKTRRRTLCKMQGVSATGKRTALRHKRWISSSSLSPLKKLSLRFSQSCFQMATACIAHRIWIPKCFCQLSAGQLRARINSKTTQRVVFVCLFVCLFCFVFWLAGSCFTNAPREER